MIKLSKNIMDGIVIGKKDSNYVILTQDKENESYNHNCIVFGKPGSSKTRGFVIPNILNQKKSSLIIADMKGELYKETVEFKKTQGYDVETIELGAVNLDDISNIAYMRKRKTALYLRVNSLAGEDKKVTGVFLSETIKLLHNMYIKNRNNFLCTLGLEIFLDEFTNLGKIENYGEFLKDCNDYGIYCYTISSYMDAITSLYGEKEMQSIIDNSDIKLHFGYSTNTRNSYNARNRYMSAFFEQVISPKQFFNIRDDELVLIINNRITFLVEKFSKIDSQKSFEDTIYQNIFDLEEWIEHNITVWKNCAKSIDPLLADLYISILFNFYDAAYDFSQYSKEAPDLNKILDAYENFICAYSKLIKFYSCFKVEIPKGIDERFYTWKRARDIIYKIKYDVDRRIREENAENDW